MSVLPNLDNDFFDKWSYRHDTVRNANQIYEPLPIKKVSLINEESLFLFRSFLIGNIIQINHSMLTR